MDEVLRYEQLFVGNVVFVWFVRIREVVLFGDRQFCKKDSKGRSIRRCDTQHYYYLDSCVAN